MAAALGGLLPYLIESGFNFVAASMARRNRETMSPMTSTAVAESTSRNQDLCGLERKCLSLAAHGHDPDTIGPRVGITPGEARVLLYCAQRKLGASNLMQAVARYLADEMTGTIDL